MSEIQDIIKQLANIKGEKLAIAEVLSVNKDKKLCSVRVTSNDVEYPEVRLSAVNGTITTGFILYPKVGSTVVIGVIDGSPEAVVVMFSDVDSIELLGNTYSIVKAETLTTELNKMKATVDAITSALLNWAVVPSDGGAALKLYAAGLLAGKTTGTYTDIKNEKIKHG